MALQCLCAASQLPRTMSRMRLGKPYQGLSSPLPVRISSRRFRAPRRCLGTPLAVASEAELFAQAASSIQSHLGSAAGHAHLQSLWLGLGDVTDAVSSAAQTAVSAAGDVGSQISDAGTQLATAVDSTVVDAAAADNGGFFGPLTHGFEAILKVLDSGLERVGVPYSYGFAIILLTILVKVATFPLTKKQVESTTAMQALAPRVKEIQDRYKRSGGEADAMNVEVSNLYKQAGVNPLAGCLPTLATIPVFIGLYRALSNVADEGLLKEGFFWIPSLAGPSTIAAQKLGNGFAWLMPFKDGAPPIGWHDAIAYLVLPVLLIIVQAASTKVMAPPPSTDPQAQQTQQILKFLPLLIGYFALNVPSGLALYWLTNTLLSTAQQVWLKGNVKLPDVVTQPAGGGTVIKPRQEEERVKSIAGKDLGARRSSRRMDEGVIDVTATSSSPTPSAAAPPAASSRGPRKGAKFQKLKAADAARKAAKAAAAAAASATGESVSGAVTAVESASPAVDVAEREEGTTVPDAPPAKNNSANGSH